MIYIYLIWLPYTLVTGAAAVAVVRADRGADRDAYLLTNLFQLIYLAHIVGSLLGAT